MFRHLAIFLPIEFFGLWLGTRLVSLLPVTTTGADSAVWLFLYVLIATGFILLTIKFFKRALKALEILSILFATEVFFEILFIDVPNPGLLAIPLALLVVAIRLIYPSSWLSKDIAIVLSILGVGALLGASLGIVASFVFLLLLSLYDFVAVFKTKHMVTMAKSIIKQNLAFAMSMPSAKGEINIGGGDLVMPIIVATSVYRKYGIISSVVSLSVGMVFLVIAIGYYVEKKGMPIPALPPIASGMVVGLIPWLI